MPDFDIPANIRSGLAMLLVNKEKASTTFAASALESWRLNFTQDLPGLSIPANEVLRFTHFQAGMNSKKSQPFSPVFLWRYRHLTALLFSDQSVVVARSNGERLQALPVIFRLLRISHKPVLVVRSLRKPEANISFAEYKGQSGLPSYKADDPEIRHMPGASALEYLEQDLELLEPLFEDLPYIVQPTQAPPKETSETISLSWLPQCWFSREDTLRLKKWAQDIADWIVMTHPEYRTVVVSLKAKHPSERETRFSEISPFQYVFTYRNTPPHGVKSGISDLDHLLRKYPKLAMPLPPEHFCGMSFAQYGQSKHKCDHRLICEKSSPNPISKHREIELLYRFGSAHNTQTIEA